MRLSLEKEVSEAFPGTRVGAVLASGFGGPDVGAISAMTELAGQKVSASFSLENLAGHPSIKPWRYAYKSFGVDPSKNKPSVEALIRRVLKGNGLPRINPLVDFYNAFSISWALPCGGEDAEKITGGVSIARAVGMERFQPLGGGPTEHPKAGEVVYVDDSKEVLTRMWNWRESDVTKITDATQTALLSFDALFPFSGAQAKAALEDFENKLAECFPQAAIASQALLSAENLSAQL
jgi:DNA/RNA-binding domain of Phe-tRNA-synthetase-like protein